MAQRKKQSRIDSKRSSRKLDFKDEILKVFHSQPGKSFTARQLIQKLGLKKKEDIKLAYASLFQLEEMEVVVEGMNGFFELVLKEVLVEGQFDHVSSRFGYVRQSAGEKDIYIRQQDINGAVDSDFVRVKLLPTRHGDHPEGQITEILRRGRTKFVGKLEVTKKYGLVTPDFRKLHEDFFIYPESLNKAKSGDKVVVEVIHWGGKDERPEGRVVEILGRAGENNAEIHSIMAEFELPFRFPQPVEEFANKIPAEISPDEIARRRDFRSITTFTIDPADAKDFDDALSFRPLGEDWYEIGVHIADVTHYVEEKSILDEEAFDRATSVYLVDRTIPMLPERLSNELCSLRPNEDKLTFSAVFEIDIKGKIRKEWFGRTLIHSSVRFSYEEAQDILEAGIGPLAEELRILNTIAKKLRKDRFVKGAVNFETTEVKFKLDEKGIPLAVIPKIRKDAHKLIEEFMLLANKQVATFVYNHHKGREKNTFVYRTHDFPDPDKVMDFASFAKRFGHKVEVEETAISKSLNTLMESIEGKPEQNILEQLAIRTMAKAKYTTDAKGHFGLAFEHYTHFTSPIRRYPDMMVHRLLQHYLNDKTPTDKNEKEQQCVHSSEREKRAADAERASIKYKQVEFMSLAEKKVFAGIISGVTEWGIFIEITETKCEGMVRLADLTDDYYEFDEKNYRVIGRRRNKVYTLGDKVQVKVKKTDIDKRLIDLVFVEKSKKESGEYPF